MGYYTSYTLTVTAHEPSLDEYSLATPAAIIADLRKLNQNLSYAVTAKGETCQSTKWYEWESDMVTASKTFPGWLLRLDGSGEEGGDIWTAYFLNGEKQIERQPPWDPPPCRLGGTK